MKAPEFECSNPDCYCHGVLNPKKHLEQLLVKNGYFKALLAVSTEITNRMEKTLVQGTNNTNAIKMDLLKDIGDYVTYLSKNYKDET
jgi:hypothetical protein